MRNDTGIFTAIIENNAIRPRAAPRIHRKAAQDGKLIPRPTDREIKAFEVVVLVGITVRAEGLALLVEAVAFVEGGVDVGLPVAG